MDNNINNIETNSSLQDYEIEIQNKQNFFTTILNKFKLNKNQKLLNSGNKIKTTNQSISSLWGLGNIRASLFRTIDSVRKTISKKLSPKSNQNSFTPEIIGKNLENQKENSISKEDILNEQHTSPIIPITETEKNVSKNIRAPFRIEISTIDTSAIKDKIIENNEKNLQSSNENTLEER